VCRAAKEGGKGGGGGKVNGTRFFSFFFFLHFNVLMQPKATKHSILSTYIDTHRVVLTDDICSIKNLSA